MANVNLSSLLPGGEAPDTITLYAGGIILAALAFLIFMRRGFSGVLAK